MEHEMLLYNFHKYWMISFMHDWEINEQNGVGSMSGVR